MKYGLENQQKKKSWFSRHLISTSYLSWFSRCFFLSGKPDDFLESPRFPDIKTRHKTIPFFFIWYSRQFKSPGKPEDYFHLEIQTLLPGLFSFAWYSRTSDCYLVFQEITRFPGLPSYFLFARTLLTTHEFMGFGDTGWLPESMG